MKPIFLAITIGLAIWASYPTEAASDVEYSRVPWSGIQAHVVSVNLNSPDLRVTVSLAKNGAGTSESFSSMLNRLQPAAAITGTFFCTRSLLPTGDIVIEGIPVYTGCLGKSVCITPFNTAEFVPYKQGHRSGWAGFETVLSAGPTLVQNRAVCLFPRDEGFSDPALFGKKRRAAIGITADNKLLMVTVDTPVYLRTLGYVMLHLGAIDAVDLDGGSSSALYCNGRQITRPGRMLTNLIVVYDNQNDYYAHRQALAPQFREPWIEGTKPLYALNPFDKKVQSVQNPDVRVLGMLTEYRQLVTTAADQKPIILTPRTTASPVKPSTAPIDLTPCLLQVVLPNNKTWPQVLYKKPTDKKNKDYPCLTPERSHSIMSA